MEPIQPLLVLIPQRPNRNMLPHPILQPQFLEIAMPANRHKFIVLKLVFKDVSPYFYTSLIDIFVLLKISVFRPSKDAMIV